MARDGVQKCCLDRLLPSPSRLWAAPLLNSVWPYRPGSPVLLWNAMFCLFGIYNIFDVVQCSTGTGFGSFAFLYMPKSPDFIGAIYLEMLRWDMLVAHQETGLK